MKKLLHWLDPHKQSFLFFRWGILGTLIVGIATVWMTLHWQDPIVKSLMDNIFVYLPNYLTHEMLGHNLVGVALFGVGNLFSPQAGEWLVFLAGNGTETLLPLVILLVLLSIEGGRWLLPPVLYWLATTFYGAGVYVQDARACSLPLTSSDMMTNYKPGEVCGDWHYILEPIGLLNYDQWFAYSFFFIGSLLCVLAFYSIWYYWTHIDQYTRHIAPPKPVPDDWTPPNIYTPQAENFPGGKQE